MRDVYKVIIVAVVAIFLGFYFYQRRPLTKEECYRLGSNERMAACLADVASRNPSPPPVTLSTNDLYLLTLNGGKMSGNSYYNPNPTYEATLRNNTGKVVQNVIAQFKFFPYSQKNTGDCNGPSDDTEYVKISNLILAGDSQGVKVVVQTPYDTSKGFSWCVKIVSAEIAQ